MFSHARTQSEPTTLFSSQATCAAENIKIFIRIRPLSEAEISASSLQCLSVEGNNSLLLRHPSIGLSGGRVEQQTFDYVGGPSTTQEQIFSYIGKNMTEYCLQGYNATIFAYGQTGSGKTYTMLGPNITDSCVGMFENLSPQLDSAVSGIIPRILVYMFDSISNAEKEVLYLAV